MKYAYTNPPAVYIECTTKPTMCITTKMLNDTKLYRITIIGMKGI